MRGPRCCRDCTWASALAFALIVGFAAGCLRGGASATGDPGSPDDGVGLVSADGGSVAGPGAGDDLGAPPIGSTCASDAFSTTRTVALDVATATVQATLTLNGAAIPSSGGSPGSLRFTDPRTGIGVSAIVAGTGSATATLTLFAGRYDVYFDTSVSQSVLPHQTVLLKRGVTVAAGKTTFVFDLRTVTLSGEITVGGGRMPDSTMSNGSRGLVQLRNVDTDDVNSFTLPATGAATYSFVVFAGTYDVLVLGCSDPSIMPQPKVMVQAALPLSATQSRTFDIEVVTLSGTVTVNGARMSDAASQRGYVYFVDPTTGSGFGGPLPSAGAATYTTQLYAGRYDVFLRGNPNQTVLPQYMTLLQRGASITTSGSRDFNVGVATLSGVVTAAGAQLPDNSGSTSRGTVELRDTQSHGFAAAILPAKGAASYSLQLFSGTYDVAVRGSAGQDALPLLGRIARVGLPVTTSATVAVDLPPIVTASGTVTIDGAAMPDSSGSASRGSVRFRDVRTNETVSAALSAKGAGTYSAKIYGGSYDVALAGDSNQDALPKLVTILERGKSFAASASHDYAVQTVTISGEIKVNGATMADGPAGSNRGGLAFRDESLDGIVVAPIAQTGPGNYSIKLFAGNYTMELTGNGTPLPEQTQRIREACVEDSLCTAPATDASGAWSMTVTGYDTFASSAWLTQSGAALTGWISIAAADAVPLGSGTRSGTDVSTIFTASCRYLAHGSLATPCMMRGWAQCAAGNGFVHWTARRTN